MTFSSTVNNHKNGLFLSETRNVDCESLMEIMMIDYDNFVNNFGILVFYFFEVAHGY